MAAVFTMVPAACTQLEAPRQSGQPFGWGNNGSGRLGDASTIDSPAPVRVR